MTSIAVSDGRLRIGLSRGERVAGLLRDLDVPVSAVRSVEVVADGLQAASGLRAPGLGIPGRRKIGTWRRPGRKTFVAVRRDEPALVVELEGVRFDRLVVGSRDAGAYAEQLRAAARAAGPSTEVVFDGLAGTLSLPAGEGPFPVVLLLTGSGPIDRDSDNRRLPLGVTAQLADALAQRGYASFRYDKRGVGRSPGDWRAVGLWDNVDDAAAAVAMLRARPEVDPGRVIVAGHSEGALQAVALAARDRTLAGLVLLAASATDGRQVLLRQVEALEPTLPKPVRLVLRLLRVDLRAKVARNHAKLEATTADVARVDLVRVNARWFREYLAHDPAEDLAKVESPVLAITGSKDLQVDPGDLARVAELVRGPVETHLLEDLTHTLRRQAGSPSLSDYKRQVRRPIDPEMTDIVLDWLDRAEAL